MRQSQDLGHEIAYKLHFLTGDIGDIHVVGGRAKFFQLLAGEDINSDQMNLRVTVLASLGGGHVDDLAGAVLDHNETVLAQGRALHRVSRGSASIGAIESVLMLPVRNVSWVLVILGAHEDFLAETDTNDGG